MHVGNTDVFSGVISTFKHQDSILQIPFSLVLLHPVMLEFIQKPFIKSHLGNKIIVVNGSKTLALW